LTDPNGLRPSAQIILIDVDFSDEEREWIEETIDEYKKFLGGPAIFNKNVALTNIEKGPLVGRLAGASYGASENEQIITLPPDLAGPIVIEETGQVEYFGPDHPRAFPNVPEGTFPNAEAYFKFTLAHEMTHALVWMDNEDIRTSFIDTFWPSVPLGCIPFATYRPGPESDPSIERNKGRDREEVLADAIAAHLFAPTLLGNTYTDWIEKTLPTLLNR
jgi:hypothetical protein